MPSKLDFLLDVLEQNAAKSLAQELLDSKWPKSGTWPEVRQHFRDALESEAIRLEDVIRLADDVECFGTQHVYLFRLSGEAVAVQRSSEALQAYLARLDEIGILNPEAPRMTASDEGLTCGYSRPGALELKYVEHETWTEKLGDERIYQADGDIIVRRLKELRRRRAVVLKVDWATRFAELRIQSSREGSSGKYRRILANYFRKLSPVLDLTFAAPVRLGHKIEQILQSKLVEPRRKKLRCDDGMVIDLSSPDGRAFFENPFVKAGSEKVRNEYTNELVNVWWLPEASEGQLTRKIPCQIGFGNEIVIPTAVRRQEAEYALRRVREFVTAVS
jgi:hypothetical protein